MSSIFLDEFIQCNEAGSVHGIGAKLNRAT